jgi:hypothetical protein
MTARSRLRRLEQAKQAVDSRPPSIEELRAEAMGEPVRPVVAALAARMREHCRFLDPWHHLREDWPA